MKDNGIGRKPLPRPHKKIRYRYLCGVADFMNEEFKCEGSKDRAVVVKVNGVYKLVILKEVEE